MAAALAPILRVLLIATITKCDKTGYNLSNGRIVSQISGVLKPPPPPISKILPMPFHGGVGRLQRQNTNAGYNYQPPPQVLSPNPTISHFKFPSPFYKQYNFNFVPQPQPFSTSPSPSLFQKVSGWLFPSVQTGHESASVVVDNVTPNKKDCNPCNLVPWIPVIRYNHIGAKNVQPNIPTYGLSSPTALNNFQNAVEQKQQSFQSQVSATPLPLLSSGLPHTNYGLPSHVQATELLSPGIDTISSTYGPPSPTHLLEVTTQRPFSSNVLIQSDSYEIPSLSYSSDSSINAPTSSSNHEIISTSHNFISSTYLPPFSSSHVTPSSSFSFSTPSSVYGAVPPQFELSDVNNREHSIQNDVEIFHQLANMRQQQLPKTSPPSGFKNSYGEPIISTNLFNIPSIYASAEIAAASKVKSEGLPEKSSKFRHYNVTLALANPAPFTINKGRNIHTLQPVALPNLSVSPLPPIFNARPFRPVISKNFNNMYQGNLPQQVDSNVEIQESIPLIEFTQSVDYPPTYIESPIIDIDGLKVTNQSKAYRNIPNGHFIDEVRDISSQASEDHISATKTDYDSSFESTGTGVGNELYDSGIPADIKKLNSVNHKTRFADLRGLKDGGIDKYRSDINLQEIDSPLLYLKPSAPHKSQGNFVLAISTPLNNHDYEIYDDLPTTTVSSSPTLSSNWDENRNEANHDLQATVQDNVYQPKIVQIIVPYMRDKENLDNIQTAETISQDWSIKDTVEHQPRKVPPIESQISTSTDNYNILSTSTEAHPLITTISYDDIDESNSAPSGFSDLYDVKEPPFDIIKLQNTIDEWTQQEYSKQFENPQRTRNGDKYAKQIPDEFFTTTVPSNYVTENNNYNYDFFDHEVSSSIRHSVTEESANVTNKLQKMYNTIDRSKNKNIKDETKETETKGNPKFHIYTSASAFRTSSTTTTTETTSTSTTTSAPWDKIQVSISPLTKEKVYVVTSKPWREPRNVTKEWYAVQPLESVEDQQNNSSPLYDDLPFKSPRFVNRPSFGFTSETKDFAKTDFSNASKSVYQSINGMENQPQFNITILSESSEQNTTSNMEENTTGVVTAEAQEYSDIEF